MKLHLDQLPDEGFELDYQEPPHVFDYLKNDEKGTGADVSDPVQVKLLVQKTVGNVTIMGRVEGAALMACSRCMEGITKNISHSFSYNCLPIEAMGDEEELSREGTDVYYYSGVDVDITALVQEQVSMSLPMKPLCKEDCKGLCPVCGANLNLSDCGCRKGQGDLRFSALEGLKARK